MGLRLNKNHGGKRPNAGRKKKWQEPTMMVRIPKRLREKFYGWLAEQTSASKN